MSKGFLNSELGSTLGSTLVPLVCGVEPRMWSKTTALVRLDTSQNKI